MASPLSEAVVSYDFEQLEPSEPPPRDAAARELAAGAPRGPADPRGGARGGFRGGPSRGSRAGTRARRTVPPPRCRRRSRGVGEVRDQTAEAVERDAIELALSLAGKVIVATLQVRPELVVEVVQGALRRVAGQRRISIVVNPADLETVRGALGDLQSQSAAVEQWDLQPDARVPAGGAAGADRRGRGRRQRPDAARAGRRGGPLGARPAPRAGPVSEPGALLERAGEAIREADLARRHGFVSNLIGLIIEATGLQAEVGEVCLVGDRPQPRAGRAPRSSASARDGRC